MRPALPRPARLTLSLLLALSATGGSAWACPTLVTGTPSQLSFDVAQLALVRQGNRTTFSVSVNPSGEPQDFALLLPVPEVPSEEEVKTLDAEVFARLDGYTGPRHVSDAGCIPSNAEGGDGAGGGGGDDGEVDVVAEYLVGEYRVFILSAEESGALQEWLDGHGFQLAPTDQRGDRLKHRGQAALPVAVAEVYQPDGPVGGELGPGLRSLLRIEAVVDALDLARRQV